MSNRVEYKVQTTARTWTTEYNGKTIKGKDAVSLDEALDAAGAPRPRILRVVRNGQ